MLQKTKGIVLRPVKYGETSLVATIFTEAYGVQAYMVQGVRSSKARQNRAGSFQPGMMLELIVYQQPNKNLQRIREFQPAYIYGALQEDVVKNSIVLFSVEVLLRLLPEHAPLPALFDFVYEYFTTLDKLPSGSIANLPLFFIIHCSREFGYELKGTYNEHTPYLDMQEGGFTGDAPTAAPFVNEEDTRALDVLIKVAGYNELVTLVIAADIRMRLTDWYITYLQRHTQHMGNIRSLAVLRTVLH